LYGGQTTKPTTKPTHVAVRAGNHSAYDDSNKIDF